MVWTTDSIGDKSVAAHGSNSCPGTKDSGPLLEALIIDFHHSCVGGRGGPRIDRRKFCKNAPFQGFCPLEGPPRAPSLPYTRITMAFSMKFLASVHSSSPPKRPTPAHTMFLPCFREVLLNFHTTTSQIMKNHKKGMTMAHVLQQGLWGEGVLHSEHL